MEDLEYILYKFRFFVIGLVIIASLLLLTLILSMIGDSTTDTKHSRTDSSISSMSASLSGSPNLVAAAVVNATNAVAESTETTSKSIDTGLKSIRDTSLNTSKVLASIVTGAAHATYNGFATAAHGTYDGMRLAGRTVGSGILFAHRIQITTIDFATNSLSKGAHFAFSAPGNTMHYLSNTAVVSSVIKPAEDHAEPLPIIDSDSPELVAALAAMKKAEEERPLGQPALDLTPVWPMHGDVTTLFGVDHRPYQHTHTGIDISDHTRPGTTPIRPFKPGRVVDVVHTSRGLGNHVILDHGSGVTSVYAHLHTTNVEVGQEVDKNTILGTEGTTGVSTGTHLHFEIRVNGQPADPRLFIEGRP